MKKYLCFYKTSEKTIISIIIRTLPTLTKYNNLDDQSISKM